MKKFTYKILCLIFILLSINGIAQVPSDYYDSAVGLTGSALKQELHDIISNGHTPISYDDLWTAFQLTDKDDDANYENDASVFDKYSENPSGADPYNYSYTADQCGTYGGEGDCYNREHSFPKSWWGGSTSEPQYTDLNHLIPTDGYVNSKRSSYAYGETSSASWTSQNGCKLGSSSYTGITGTIFEPIDEFKGDFARMLFYMATRYKDEIPNWYSDNNTDMRKVFQSDGEFQPAYYEMIYAWHQNDPVSAKEDARNDAVYNEQGNANPYITHPEWVCEVFGGCTVNPEPDNYPTDFTADAVSDSQIDLSWTDATGTNLPDGYIILANTTNSFSDPVDGTDPATDSDLSDGSAVVKVAHGSKGTYSFTRLNASTQYFFKIYSYANSGTNIDFKTDGIAPSDDATTLAPTTGGGCADNLLISEYGEGSSGNSKYVEIYNGTGATVDLSDYKLWRVSNGGSWPEATYSFSAGTLANDATIVIANNSSDVPGADEYDSGFCSWNGNDAVGLAYNGGSGTSYSLIDGVGTDGADPGTGWDVAGTTDATKDHYLIRKSTITSPNTDWSASAGTNTTDSEWEVYSYSTGSAQAGHTMSCSTPTITLSTANLTGFTYVVGNGPSAEQSFTVEGTNLTADISITPPANYEISTGTGGSFVATNPITLTQSGGTVSTTTIYVRLKAGLSIGTYNSENITASSAGATDKTVTCDGNVTGNNSSNIVLESTFNEPANIPYINYQSADIINDGNDIEVAQFTIQDGGGSADADNVSTELTDITFSLTNSADIRRVAIYDGATEIAEVAGAASVTFSGISLTAPDDGSKTFSLRVSFNSTVTDNDQFQFTITSATAASTGSTFAAADAGGAQSTIAGDENRIEVVASALTFTIQPTNTVVNVAMSPDPQVTAVDANNNTDVDYSDAVTVTSDGSLSGSPVSGTWSSGVATFANLIHTVIQVGRTLTASSGTLTDATSNLFDITDVPTNCASDLIISEYYEGASYDKYLELYNDSGADIDLSGYKISIYSNGSTTASDIPLSGTIVQGGTFIIANSSANSTILGNADATSGSLGFNGNDAVALRTTGDVYVDVIGVVGTDPGTEWGTGLTSTADNMLIRKSTITAGDVIATDAFDPVDEWDGYDNGDYSFMGSHTMVCTCNEPTVEASNLTFANITATSMDLSWSIGDGTSRIVVACEASPVSFVPTDNTTYTANSSFGSGTDLGSGNYVIYNGSGSSVTLTNLNPGTVYYFKIYEYGCQAGSEDYLTTGTPEEGNETTLPNNVSGFQVDCATATTANLSWTLPTGSYDGIMIAVLPNATPDAPACAGNTLTSPNTDFSAASVYCGNASGAVYIYNNVGTNLTVTGLTSGTSYHFMAFTYKNDAWSSGTEIIQTAEVSDVSDLYSSCGNGESMISWTNPSSACMDEVIIAVNTVSVSASPSGTYTANSLDYTDAANPTLSDGSVVVYNGSTSPQTVTGLTNGTTYYFKVFVRSGTDWSAGVEVNCTATTATFLDYGDLAIVGVNTDYTNIANDDSDEIQFVCFKDITPETSIDFTDNGYERLYAGKWADSEGTITLTRNSGASVIPAGTVITVRGRNAASNWHVFLGSGTPNGSLTNDDANWTITDGGAGNNVFDLNVNDQIWMMQGGTWDNPAGDHNATYSGKVLYGWTAIGWEPAPGYDDTKGSTIFPSSACSVTNLVGVLNEDKVRFDSTNTAATQREWITRFNDEQQWTGYTDSTTYQNGGTLPDVITISGTGFSGIYKWTGETSSDWDDCTNWLNLKVPDANADVQFVSDDCQNDIVILPGQTVICKSLDISGGSLIHTIKAEGDATAVIEVHGDVTIGGTGTAGVLDFDDGTGATDGTLKVYGNWYENIDGGFLEGNSSVEFIGSVAQSINTVSTEAGFYNLKIDNLSASGVSLANSGLVTGTLNLAGGIFNLNGADLTISGTFTGTNGVFAGHQWSNMTVNGTGTISYNFNFATPQELGRFNMNRTGETAVIGTNLTVDDLQIDAGTVQLSAGKYYTVNNSITNTPGTNGLVLKSDATGTASLIQPSANISATCERYMTGGRWNYFFTPLDNVATSTFNTGNPNFYWYDETINDYWDATTIYNTTGWTAESAGTLSTNKGYIQYYNTAKTYNLTGGNLYDPNSGNKVFTLTYNNHGSGSPNDNGVTAPWSDFDGWNLIGNPYTSAIDWNQVSLNNVENVIYYYDGSNYKYFGTGTNYDQGITLNGGSQYIPANQGVFVKATVNNGTVSIPTAARTHDAQSFWKKSHTVPDNFLKLSIEKEGFTDETIIRTLPDATEGHDAKYDAYKLFSLDKTKPMFYSRNEDNSHIYAVNSIPEFTGQKVVPTGMFIGIDGYYTIRLNENGFENMHIYLEDKDLNETINLILHPEYTFYQNASDYSERFNIRFNLNSAPYLNDEIPDQIIPVNETYTYTIPDNIFADKDFEDVLTISVSSEDGNQLPKWLNFDNNTMTFNGVPTEIQTVNIKVTATDLFGAKVSDVYKLSVTSTSGIQDVNNENVRIYPNPSNGLFVIEINKPVNAKVLISDISGKQLFYKNMTSNRTEVNMNSYPKGIYLIKIDTGSNFINKRIIIQ